MTEHSDRPYLARSERLALADLMDQVGEAAPTLCGDWTTKDLAVHLLVRERSPLGAPGIVIPALSRMTDKVSAGLASEPFGDLVELLRHPSRFSPAGFSVTDRLANTVEFFIHHEDVRRAQPAWTARDLPRRSQDELWRSLSTMGRMLARSLPVSTVVERSDTGEIVVLRRGPHPVRLTGLPSEILLFLYGRKELHGLEFTGPDDAVARLRSAKLGL